MIPNKLYFGDCLEIMVENTADEPERIPSLPLAE